MLMMGWKRSTGRKTCPRATLSTTNVTFIGPGSNWLPEPWFSYFSWNFVWRRVW